MRSSPTSLGVLAACLACAGALAFGGVGSATTKGPMIVVRPSTGLHGGEVVRVTGARFRPKDHVFLVECLVGAKGEGQCDVSTAKAATVTAKGVLPWTTFRVVAGSVGAGKCGTRASNVAACDISVGNEQGGDTAFKRIQFVRPK